MGVGPSCPSCDEEKLRNENALLKLKENVKEKLAKYTDEIDSLKDTIKQKDKYISTISTNYDGPQPSEFLTCDDEKVTCTTYKESVTNAAKSVTESSAINVLKCGEKDYDCGDIENIMKYDNVHTYPEQIQFLEDKMYLRECDVDPHLNVDRGECIKKGHNWVDRFYCWNTEKHERNNAISDHSSCIQEKNHEWVRTKERHVAVRWYKTLSELRAFQEKQSDQCSEYTKELEDTAYIHQCRGDSTIKSRQECADAGHAWERGICVEDESLADQKSCQEKGYTWYVTQTDYRTHERDMLYNKLCRLPDFKGSCYPVDLEAAKAFDTGSYILKTVHDDTIKVKDDYATTLQEQVGAFDLTLARLREDARLCTTLTQLKIDEKGGFIDNMSNGCASWRKEIVHRTQRHHMQMSSIRH